jgi:hypothetical protein
MQRSPPGQQPCAVRFGLGRYAFDVAEDGFSQPRTGFFERPALNCDIEIKAKCLPLIAVAAGNAIKVATRIPVFTAAIDCCWQLIT